MNGIIVDKTINHLNKDIASTVRKVKMARTQVASEICADIRKMVNNIDYSDVVFLCKDGARVHASRLFLVARSAIFHCMLLNGMTESQLSKITLHEVSSTALLPVMEFLYTGTLQEYAPKDWKNAYEIIGAAKFFLLDGLELIAMDYLLLATTEVQVDIEAAAKFLSIAVEFVGIFGETVDLIARNLVCILESASDSFKLRHLQALTYTAFEYFLEKTKYENAEPELLLNAEFLRLKNIILWCASKEFAPKEPLTVHAVPAEVASTLELLEKKRPFKKPYHQFEIYNGIKTALALSVKQYLPLVNFQKISPRKLANIFEPMDIIPSSIIMDAFRFHVLRSSYCIVDKLRWSTHCNNYEIYRVSRDGSVIQQTAPGIGYATCDLSINHYGSGKTFEWEIIIEEVCDGFIEIGLYHRGDADLPAEDGYSLSGQPGGWALRMDPQGLSINRKGEHQDDEGDPNFVSYGKDCSELVYGKDYGQENSRVKVHLDEDMVCRFFVNNDKFGDLAASGRYGKIAWTDIPYGIMYPAVSLGTGSNGRVRIRILQVRGQDL